MPVEIIVPRLGWSMEEGAFVAWLKNDGDLVRAGDPLFSIEGDKAVQEIESLDSGILRIAPAAPKPGDSIRVGDVLGHLLTAAEAAAPRSAPILPREPTPTAPAARQSTSRARADVPTSSPTPSRVPESNVSPGSSVSSPLSSTRRKAPTISPRALRIAGELGVDWTTLTGSGRTGRIRERDVRAAIESQPSRPSLMSAATEPARMLSTQAGAGTVRVANQSPMNSFLVTGGGGFIGTWVVRELLKRGLDVVALDTGTRPPPRWERVLGRAGRDVPFVQGNLLERDALAELFARHAFTHVIHLAALLTPACQTDPWEGCQVNVVGSMALLEQIRAAGDRIRGFSYASSVAVFGEEPDYGSRIQGGTGAGIGVGVGSNSPLTFYGAFKKSVELLADQYWRHFRIPSVGLRPQVVYGPEREVGLTAGPSLAARAAAHGESYVVGYTGRVGYDFVDDVAQAFVRAALEAPPGAHVVDLPGEIASVEQVVAAIVAAEPAAEGRIMINGPPIPAHAPPQPNWIMSIFPDWRTTSLIDGVRRTVDYYRSRRDGALASATG